VSACELLLKPQALGKESGRAGEELETELWLNLGDERIVSVEGDEFDVVMEGDGCDEEVERARGEAAVGTSAPKHDGNLPKIAGESEQGNRGQRRVHVFALITTAPPTNLVDDRCGGDSLGTLDPPSDLPTDGIGCPGTSPPRAKNRSGVPRVFPPGFGLHLLV
jgi:hypothetical protein